jgi:hypothetical protein
MIVWAEAIEIVEDEHEMIPNDLNPDSRFLPLRIQNVNPVFPSFGVGLPC